MDQLNRIELPEDERWNLASLFPSIETWNAEREALQAEVPTVEALRGTLGKSANALLTALVTTDQIDERLDRLFAFAMLSRDEDTRDSGAIQRYEQSMNLAVSFGRAASWIAPEMLSIPDEQLLAFVDAEPGLEPFRRSIERTIRERPHIRTAEDAHAVVVYAKYPPIGERSFGGNMPHLGYRSMPPVESMAALNEATMVVVMIETIDALENVEEIIAVDGIDMLLVGTNDLCAEFGIPGQYEHEKVHAAYAKCIAAARAVGKHVGVGGLATRPKLVEQFVKMGARYVSTGADLGFLLAAATEKAKAVREIAL